MERLRGRQAEKLYPIAIHFPREQRSRKITGDDGCRATEKLIARLAPQNFSFALEATVPNVGRNAVLSIAVPRNSRDVTTAYLKNGFTDAVAVPDDESVIFRSSGAAAGIFLKARTNFILPFKTHRDTNAEVFPSPAEFLEGPEPLGEGIGFQILLRRAPPAIEESIARAVAELRRGKLLSEVLRGTESGDRSRNSWISFFRAFRNGSLRFDREAIATIERKQATPIFEANVRLAGGAISSLRAKALLEHPSHSFARFTAPLRNEFRPMQPRNLTAFVARYVAREFDPTHTIILNAAEVATIFRLPPMV